MSRSSAFQGPRECGNRDRLWPIQTVRIDGGGVKDDATSSRGSVATLHPHLDYLSARGGDATLCNVLQRRLLLYRELAIIGLLVRLDMKGLPSLRVPLF